MLGCPLSWASSRRCFKIYLTLMPAFGRDPGFHSIWIYCLWVFRSCFEEAQPFDLPPQGFTPYGVQFEGLIHAAR